MALDPKKTVRVGLIGLGLVGSALAERLLKAGYDVFGFDIDQEKRAAFANLGGHAVLQARDAVQNVEFVVLSLPNSEVVQAVMAEVQPLLMPSLVVLDTSTGDPDCSVTIATLLAQQKVFYCDATIVGSSEHVRSLQAIVLVGGDATAVDNAQRLLATFSKQIFHTGVAGSGARMKLVVNLVLGLNRAVLAEGLAFANSCGISEQQALEILRAGVSYSAVMDTKGPKMVARDFAPQARLSQHLKDVRIILDLATKQTLPLPLSSTHRHILEYAEKMGLGSLDNSAILKVYEAKRVQNDDQQP